MTRYSKHTPFARLTIENGTLALTCSYEPSLTAKIKALPQAERRWDPNGKRWLVHPRHGQTLTNWVAEYIGVAILAPQIVTTPVVDTRVLDVRYIGITKWRDDGWSAYGYCNGEWSVVFPELVLRSWFDGVVQENERPPAQSLYGVLCASQNADDEGIKRAYRRMAKQWHPDYCKEKNAVEIFMRIQEAYEILSNADKRARYDAGLALEATMKRKVDWQTMDLTPGGYRSPLRCGYIMAEGIDQVGRFITQKILAWEDIVNSRGQVLVTSWQPGNDTFTERWV